MTEMMLEERSLLATHDARVTKHRTTKAAVRALADSEIPANVPDDVAEQAAGLMAERQALKDAREIRDCQKPLKAYVISLNSNSSSIECREIDRLMVDIVHGNYREEEIAIAQNAIADFKAYIAEQSESLTRPVGTIADSSAEYIDKLNKELEVFRATFNRRVSYFAAYQIVSDSVCHFLPVAAPANVRSLLQSTRTSMQRLTRPIKRFSPSKPD
jgi:E3 ubiquitin-protein ligase SHPRH